MNRYIRFYQEDENQNDENNNGVPDWLDEKITELLQTLRDNDFGNEDSRKSMIDIFTSMHNSKDKRARKAFKAVGDLFSEIGDELIKFGQEIEEE